MQLKDNEVKNVLRYTCVYQLIIITRQGPYLYLAYSFGNVNYDIWSLYNYTPCRAYFQNTLASFYSSFTWQNWFLDPLELWHVEERSHHPLQNANLRSQPQGEEHGEEEDTPERGAGQLCEDVGHHDEGKAGTLSSLGKNILQSILQNWKLFNNDPNLAMSR